jgi:hypothetical protein
MIYWRADARLLGGRVKPGHGEWRKLRRLKVIGLGVGED